MREYGGLKPNFNVKIRNIRSSCNGILLFLSLTCSATVFHPQLLEITSPTPLPAEPLYSFLSVLPSCSRHFSLCIIIKAAIIVCYKQSHIHKLGLLNKFVSNLSSSSVIECPGFTAVSQDRST